MSQSAYFFDKEQPSKPERGLPRETPGLAGHMSEADAQRLEHLCDEIVSPHGRALAGTSTITFSALFEMVADFAGRYPTVTAEPCSIGLPVRICAHDLYFAIGTALHYVGLAGYEVTLRTEESEQPAILLSRRVTTATESEVEAAFGLNFEDRRTILTQLADKAGFSLSLRTGDVAELVFSVPCTRTEHIRLLATDDPSLFAAFMLPLTYFHY